MSTCVMMGTKVFFNESNDNATNCTLCEEGFWKGKYTMSQIYFKIVFVVPFILTFVYYIFK